jgi:hypothetical protein
VAPGMLCLAVGIPCIFGACCGACVCLNALMRRWDIFRRVAFLALFFSTPYPVRSTRNTPQTPSLVLETH